MFRVRHYKFSSQDDKGNDLAMKALLACMLATLALAVLATLASQAS